MKSRIWKMTTWRPSPRFRSLQFFIYAVQWSGELFPIDEHNHCKLLTCKRILHPRRPRGGQSGREKRRDKSFQAQAEKPLGTDSHRTISKRSSDCWLLIGHKNALYYCAQSANSISWVLFVSSYTTAIDSITACLAHAPKKCTQSGIFQLDINATFQNTGSLNTRA